MFKSSKALIWLGILIVVIILFILNLLFSNTTITIFTAVLSSIVVSIVISIYYNEELHKAINTYNKIGLKSYYSNFEMAQDKIRASIAQGKEVDIYVMYADRFFGSSNMTLKSLLSKRESKLRIFLYHPENIFIESYGHYWGELNQEKRYTREGLKELINSVRTDLLKLYQEIDGERGALEIFEIMNSPISYSFYRIDNNLFYVPSKNTKQRNFKTPVFYFSKTKDANSMFSKIEMEISTMLNDNEVIKLEDK